MGDRERDRDRDRDRIRDRDRDRERRESETTATVTATASASRGRVHPNAPDHATPRTGTAPALAPSPVLGLQTTGPTGGACTTTAAPRQSHASSSGVSRLSRTRGSGTRLRFRTPLRASRRSRKLSRSRAAMVVVVRVWTRTRLR